MESVGSRDPVCAITDCEACAITDCTSYAHAIKDCTIFDCTGFVCTLNESLCPVVVGDALDRSPKSLIAQALHVHISHIPPTRDDLLW